MTRKLNNAHLRDIADTVDPSGTTGAKMLNNEYLERIANGIGSITGIVDPGTGKIDSSMLEGVIDASNLPSYVDDVIEGYYHQGAFYSDSAHANAITGETGKIYVDVPGGATYRWGGSAYAKVGGSDVEIATTQDAVTGTNDTKVMTPLKTKQAIDASGVPEMSAAVRGGAKLDAYGGLALRDGALGVGSLVQESNGTVRGGIASLTAKGHAEQASTTGKNLVPQINETTASGITCLRNNDGSIVLNGSATTTQSFYSDSVTLSAGTYTLSGTPQGGSSSSYQLDVRVGSTIITGAIDYGNGATFTINESSAIRISARIASGYTCNNLTIYPQLELGSTATEYEPYSGGAPSPSPSFPQEIVTVTGHAITGKTGRYVDLEVRGRNLWGGERMADDVVAFVNNSARCSKYTDLYGRYFTLTPGMDIHQKPLSTGVRFNENSQYTIILKVGHDTTSSSNTNVVVEYTDGTYQHISAPQAYGSEPIVITFVTDGNKSVSSIDGGYYSAVTKLYYDECGVFEGVHTVDEFEPYCNSTTPIPLPSRGWVGSLPDGTADVLRLDGAGKVTWELPTSEVVLDGSSGRSFGTTVTTSDNGNRFTYVDNSIGTISSTDRRVVVLCDHGRGKNIGSASAYEVGACMVLNGYFYIVLPTEIDTQAKGNTWLQSNPVTVLYPLATPVTEDCGYVDMPSIPGDATVSIPELDALGVRYFADDAVVEYGRQIYERVRNEYAGRISDLEAAVAELATA